MKRAAGQYLLTESKNLKIFIGPPVPAAIANPTKGGKPLIFADLIIMV
jgi:hypothetical protein